MIFIEKMKAFFKMFKFQIMKKIAFKLFITYFLAISIPVVALSILSLRFSSSAVEAEYINFKESLNAQISANIDENLSNLDKQSAFILLNILDISNFLDYTPKIIDDNYFKIQKRIVYYSLSILQNNERLNGIGLINLDGDVVFYMDRDQSSTKLSSVKKEKWFSDTLAANGTAILLEPHINDLLFNYKNSTNTTKKTITISRVIKDFDNNYVAKGVLVFDQNVEQFANLVSNSKTIEGETLIILGKENSLVYSNDILSNEKNVQKITNYISSHKQNSFKTVLNGEKILLSSNKSSKYGWKVVSLIPLSTINKKTAFLKSINFYLILLLIII